MRSDFASAAVSIPGMPMNPIPRRCLACLAFWIAVFAVACGSRALADGKVFPPVARAVPVTIPDQRALIHWAGGEERLVIETRIVADGTNFGWVVPLPSAPKVEAATTGLFPTLAALLEPRVVHAPDRTWGWWLAAAGLAWWVATVRGAAPAWCAWTSASAVTLGIAVEGSFVFGAVAFAILAYMTWRLATVGRIPAAEAVCVVGLLVVLAGLLLPALATAKAQGSRVADAGGVEVLGRQRAGVYETTTVAGRDAAALRGWLATNGYAFPAEAEPVIAGYAARGWVFACSRVRREATVGGPGALHPLQFTFASPEPVYPLQLTAVGNGDLDLELFVFGAARAAVDGLRVRECRAVEYATESHEWIPTLGPMIVAHEGLRRAAPGAAVVTRLRGTLSPAAMGSDAVVRWEPFREQREVLYSARGAVETALNRTLWLALGPAVAAGILAARRREVPRRGARWMAAGVALASVGFGVVIAGLPVVRVTIERSFFYRRSMARHDLAAAKWALDGARKNDAPFTLPMAREAIRREFERLRGSRGGAGILPREEDSPWNYTLHEVPGGVEFRWYDAAGRTRTEW